MIFRARHLPFFWPRLAQGIFILFSLAALAVLVWQGPLILPRIETLASQPLPLLLLAVFFYSLSHILRIFRLWCMLVENAASFRALAVMHLHTAWATAILPFKTGEFLRASELMRLSRDPYVGLAAFALEKIFDAAILLSFAVIAGAGGIAGAHFRFFTLLVASVVIVALALWFTVPGTIFYGRELLLTHSRSPRGLVYMKWIDAVERFYGLIQSVLKFRLGLITMLSLLGWMADFAAFACLTNAAAGIPALAKLFIDTHRKFATDITQIAANDPALAYNTLIILLLSLAGIPAMIISCLWRRRATRLPRTKPYRIFAYDHPA